MAVARFVSEDVQTLFEDKNIVVIGDSVQRSVYKDLVCLLREDQLLTLDELKEKGEETFQEDNLIEGGVKTGLHNGTNYREVRKYGQANTTVMFYFVTRCYGEYMQSILDDFKLDPPHVIIMNSCLWDLHRYGKTANAEYISNMMELLHAIDLAVPYEDRLFIWNATLPVRESVKAGFLPPGVGHTLPAEDIRKANLFVRDQIKSYGERFIFLDLHETFYKHLDLRVKDGVHWNDFAHRKITCLILSEISKRWNFEIPSKSPISPTREGVPSVSSGLSVNGDQPPNTSKNGHMGNSPARNGVTMKGPVRNQPMNNGIRMNGFSGDFPRGNGPIRPLVNGIPCPRANVTPCRRGNSPPGSQLPGPTRVKVVPGARIIRSVGPRPPGTEIKVLPVSRVIGPAGPRVKRLSQAGPPGFNVRPPMSNPTGHLGNNPLSLNLIRNSPLGNAPMRDLVEAGRGKMVRKRGGLTRRGRIRSATVDPVSFRARPGPRGMFRGPPRFVNNNYLFPPNSLNDTFPPFHGKRKFVEEDNFTPAYKFPRKFM